MIDFTKEHLFFTLGNQEISIPKENLYMKKEQFYTIKKKGLTQINENDVHDISEKGDIIVNIIFT